MEALKNGIVNLDKHIENIHKYGVPVVVTLNSFVTDTEEEYEFIKKHCEELGCEFALSNVWADGGAGGIELADKVLASFDKKSNFKPLYEDELPLEDKIMTIAKKYMEQMVLHMILRLRRNLTILHRWALEIFLYVWLRHSILCLMMHLS